MQDASIIMPPGLVPMTWYLFEDIHDDTSRWYDLQQCYNLSPFLVHLDRSDEIIPVLPAVPLFLTWSNWHSRPLPSTIPSHLTACLSALLPAAIFSTSLTLSHCYYLSTYLLPSLFTSSLPSSLPLSLTIKVFCEMAYVEYDFFGETFTTGEESKTKIVLYTAIYRQSHNKFEYNVYISS